MQYIRITIHYNIVIMHTHHVSHSVELHSPVINIHGVGLRLPKLPLFIADCNDLIGAMKVKVDMIHPMVGQT